MNKEFFFFFYTYNKDVVEVNFNRSPNKLAAYLYAAVWSRFDLFFFFDAHISNAMWRRQLSFGRAPQITPNNSQQHILHTTNIHCTALNWSVCCSPQISFLYQFHHPTHFFFFFFTISAPKSSTKSKCCCWLRQL